MCKKIVLLKTFYYKKITQDGSQLYANRTIFNTNPLTNSRSSITHITDKNYEPIENNFIQWNIIIIQPINPNSGINKQTFQENIMIKTKYGFLSANTFFFEPSLYSTTTPKSADYQVTASSEELKNAVLVRIDFDNDGTIFSNGVKYARRVLVYGYK